MASNPKKICEHIRNIVETFAIASYEANRDHALPRNSKIAPIEDDPNTPKHTFKRLVSTSSELPQLIGVVYLAILDECNQTHIIAQSLEELKALGQTPLVATLQDIRIETNDVRKYVRGGYNAIVDWFRMQLSMWTYYKCDSTVNIELADVLTNYYEMIGTEIGKHFALDERYKFDARQMQFLLLGLRIGNTRALGSAAVDKINDVIRRFAIEYAVRLAHTRAVKKANAAKNSAPVPEPVPAIVVQEEEETDGDESDSDDFAQGLAQVVLLTPREDSDEEGVI